MTENVGKEIKVVIIGSSGSGKSTISALIANALEQAGITCIVQIEDNFVDYTVKEYTESMAELREHFKTMGTDSIINRKVYIEEQRAKRRYSRKR